MISRRARPCHWIALLIGSLCAAAASAVDIPRASSGDVRAVFWEATRLARLGQYDAATNGAVAVLAQAGDPEDIPPSAVRPLLAVLPVVGDHSARLAAALAEAGYQPDTGVSAIIPNAVGYLADKGEFARADALLARPIDHETMAELLTDRRFARFWPALEERAGPGMALSDSAAIAEARRRLARRPDDIARLTTLVRTLSTAGRHVEADVAARSIVTTPAAVDSKGAWLIEAHAGALLGSGQVDDAFALWKPLAELNIDDRPWLVGIVIDYASALAFVRPAAAMPAVLERAERAADRFGSAFARQLVRTARVCALRDLGRSAELPPLMEAVRLNMTASGAATVHALLCADDMAVAGALTVKLLSAPGRDRDRLIAQLQAEGVGDDPASRNDARRWARLRKRADVKAAFRAVARDLPAAFLPATQPALR